MATRRLYQIKDGQPVMQRSVVLVVDILGFKQISERGTEQEFVRLYKAIRKAQKELRPKDGLDYVIKVYTDNVVICWPLDDRDDGELALGVTMLKASAFQVSLFMSGYFARGGIAVGPVYADSIGVFGPALIEAHETEVKTKQPRIELAGSAVKYISRHSNYYGEIRGAPQNEEVLVDAIDQSFFIDYLSGYVGNFDMPDQAAIKVMPKVLSKHQKFIQAYLKLKPNIKKKYVWLARYHNFFLAHRQSGPNPAVHYVPRYPAKRRFVTLAEILCSRSRTRGNKLKKQRA